MICKTAPGSIDGKGQFVTMSATDEEIKKIDPNQMKPHDELLFFVQNVIYDDQTKKELIETILQYGIDFINAFPKDNVDMAT